MASNGPFGQEIAASKSDIARPFHWADYKTNKVTRPEDPYTYLYGFGNEHQSELIPEALPVGQNSPQQCPYGLYAEQVTGSSFAASRAAMRRAFLYRLRPSAVHEAYKKVAANPTLQANFLPTDKSLHTEPSQLSWKAFQIPSIDDGPVDFTQGLHTLGGSGHPNLREAIAYHIFTINSSMSSKAFVNIDGDFLIVPQEGHLDITTEFGHLYLQPSEICVIHRGIRFKVDIVQEYSPAGARGYVIETWGTALRIRETSCFQRRILIPPRAPGPSLPSS